MYNGLSNDQQSANGKLTKPKGDWCELMAQAHYCKLGWWIYPKMSGPIDLIYLIKKQVKFVSSILKLNVTENILRQVVKKLVGL